MPLIPLSYTLLKSTLSLGFCHSDLDHVAPFQVFLDVVDLPLEVVVADQSLKKHVNKIMSCGRSAVLDIGNGGSVGYRTHVTAVLDIVNSDSSVGYRNRIVLDIVSERLMQAPTSKFWADV